MVFPDRDVGTMFATAASAPIALYIPKFLDAVRVQAVGAASARFGEIYGLFALTNN